MFYTFICKSPDHPADKDRSFVVTIHHLPTKRIDNYPCVVCGRNARRDLMGDLASVNLVGSTPISNSTTIKGSYANTTEFAFGRHKTNPDGSADTNHRPFRDSGELNKFMNGGNQLGKPVLNDKGEPVRRKDGSIVRRGVKLFQYGANATPTHSAPRRRDVNYPSTSISARQAAEATGRSAYFDRTPVVRLPQRRAKA